MRIIRRALRLQGLSTASIALIMKSITTQSAKVYDNKWLIFTSWCECNNVPPLEASSKDIVEFFTYLVEERGKAPSTVDGYRAAIRSVYKHIQREQVLDTPMVTQQLQAVRSSRRPPLPVPKWNLPLVLYYLRKPPFEPLEQASFAHLSRKTAFLLLLATALQKVRVTCTDQGRATTPSRWRLGLGQS